MKGTITFENDRVEFENSFTCLCPKCNQLPEYNQKYDAYYCLDCKIWAESICKDPDCTFCKDRPETPPDKE